MEAGAELKLTSNVEIGVQPICQETNHLDTFGDDVLLGAVETNWTPIVKHLALAEMNEVASVAALRLRVCLSLCRLIIIIIDCSAIGCRYNVLIGQSC